MWNCVISKSIYFFLAKFKLPLQSHISTKMKTSQTSYSLFSVDAKYFDHWRYYRLFGSSFFNKACFFWYWESHFYNQFKYLELEMNTESTFPYSKILMNTTFTFFSKPMWMCHSIIIRISHLAIKQVQTSLSAAVLSTLTWFITYKAFKILHTLESSVHNLWLGAF